MSNRWVLDASAAVRLVLREPGSEGLQERLRGASLVLVPSLYFSEVANALWKYASLAADLTPETCAERLTEAEFLVDEVVDDRELIVEAFHQAVTHGHPVYDLLYAVLARRTAARVLTRDRRLAGLLEALSIPHHPRRAEAG